MTQVEAAKTLGITQARVSDIKRGKIGQFSLDLLVCWSVLPRALACAQS